MCMKKGVLEGQAPCPPSLPLLPSPHPLVPPPFPPSHMLEQQAIRRALPLAVCELGVGVCAGEPCGLGPQVAPGGLEAGHDAVDQHGAQLLLVGGLDMGGGGGRGDEDYLGTGQGRGGGRGKAS